MALSGSGTLDTFLDTSYSGGGPDYRWRYEWTYSPAEDKLSVTLALQGYSTNTGVSFGLTKRSTSQNWATFYIDGTQYDYYSDTHYANHTVSGWQDILSFTREFTGKSGTAEISIRNYSRVYYNGSSLNYYSDSTQSFTIKADRGLARIYTGGAWHMAIPFVFKSGTWRQAIPYIFKNSAWHIGG